jgi:hypothetical protein
MRTQQPLVFARITAIGPLVYGPAVYGPLVYGPAVYGPAVRALLLFFSRILVRRTACVRRTWVRIFALFGGAMVLIRLSVALPSFLPVFRGPRFSFQAFRSPLIIEDNSRRDLSTDLRSAAGSLLSGPKRGPRSSTRSAKNDTAPGFLLTHRHPTPSTGKMQCAKSSLYIAASRGHSDLV